MTATRVKCKFFPVKVWQRVLFSNRAFSLMWPASMQIYWSKRKCLHEKIVQLPQDRFGTPTWLPFYCFGIPIWPPWRHVKTLFQVRFNWRWNWRRALVFLLSVAFADRPANVCGKGTFIVTHSCFKQQWLEMLFASSYIKGQAFHHFVVLSKWFTFHAFTMHVCFDSVHVRNRLRLENQVGHLMFITPSRELFMRIYCSVM